MKLLLQAEARNLSDKVWLILRALKWAVGCVMNNGQKDSAEVSVSVD